MNDAQLASLKQSIRETISSGKAVAVIGWKDSNHSTLTRSLPDKKFLFFENPPNSLGQNVGFVLFTKFINHKDSSRFKDKKDCHAIVLGTGRIKEIFESCKDALVVDASVDNDSGVVAKVDTGNALVENNELLDFLTQPSKEKPKMSDIAKFQKAFLERCDSDGLLGVKNVGKIIKELNLSHTAQQLIVLGWIEPVKTEGLSRAGWYKKGRALQEDLLKEEIPLPESPAGRAEFLVAQKPALISEKAELEAKIAEINKKLQMISDAEEMFGRISEALGK